MRQDEKQHDTDDDNLSITPRNQGHPYRICNPVYLPHMRNREYYCQQKPPGSFQERKGRLLQKLQEAPERPDPRQGVLVTTGVTEIPVIDTRCGGSREKRAALQRTGTPEMRRNTKMVQQKSGQPLVRDAPNPVKSANKDRGTGRDFV